MFYIFILKLQRNHEGPNLLIEFFQSLKRQVRQWAAFSRSVTKGIQPWLLYVDFIVFELVV